MGLIFKIAWRNILRHKGKSIIIGLILFLGSLIMTIGNGVIAGMEYGITQNIINGFTGDIVIISGKQDTDNVLFTLYGKAIEPVNNFPEIKKVLQDRPEVERFLPAGKNLAMVLNEEGGDPSFAFVMGVDFEKYQQMFPQNIEVIEGRLLDKNEKGVLIPTGSRKMFYDYFGMWFKPAGEELNRANFLKETKEEEGTKDPVTQDNIVFLGYNEKNTAMDVRLDIKGIVKFKALNTIFGHYNIIDIESYRECLGYFSAESKYTDIPEDKKKMLEMETQNIDTQFSSESLFSAESSSDSTGIDIESLKPSAPAIKNRDIESGTYNLVFVKLKKGVSINKGLSEINSHLQKANLGVRAVSWKKAFGLVGSMATIIKGALFGFVMLLFIVAIIIIINTLSMAALERTTEIGMMRAVGARKSFISSMFLAETGILSFLFGGIGIIFGIIIVEIIPLFNITSDNDMVQLLFGGDTFSPVLNTPDIMLTILQLTLVTIIAAIYPVKVAKNITPLDAIVRD